MNTPEIETGRLLLRKFTASDMDALYLLLRDGEVNRFLPWYPVKSMQETRRFYEARYAAKYRQPKAYAYAICLKGNESPVGYINVDTEEPYDLGYGLCRAFWNRGIATEAGRALVEQVKRDGIPYITATHDVNNPGSGRVMQKLGMHYCYSYEEQWQPKNIPVLFRLYQLNLNRDDGFVYQKYWDMSPNHFVEEI